MNDNELRERLLRADAATPATGPGCVEVDIAAIRARARRQTIQHRAVIVSIAVFAGMVAFFASRPPLEPESQSDPPIAQHRALSPMKSRRSGTKSPRWMPKHGGLRRSSIACNHADRLAAICDESTVVPITNVDSTPGEQIDRAAGIGVISADFLANELDRAAEAAESYRSVVKHFPESRWAAVARERLSQIEMMN